MSCQETTEGRQTEYEFFQQLLANKKIIDCAGPLTRIGFTSPALAALQVALLKIGLTQEYLDNYLPQVLDSAHMSLEMCPKHWIQHAQGLGTLGAQHDNDTWEQLAYYIFRVVCLSNSWDYKEILNYTKSVKSIKED